MSNPDREVSRLEALRNERLYKTEEMLDWLSKAAGVPCELSEAFLGSWVGLLRQRILHHIRTDEWYLGNVREGRIGLGLSPYLGPADCPPDAVFAQFGDELELPYDNIFSLIGCLRAKFVELDEERKAFEPIGWVELAERALNEESAELLPRHADEELPLVFLVRFWSDFLSPVVEVRRPLVEGQGEGDSKNAFSRWRE